MRIKCRLALPLALLLSSCGSGMTPDDTPRWVVTQYSGGKSIHRWEVTEIREGRCFWDLYVDNRVIARVAGSLTAVRP